jgi:hypothetical protein
MSDPFAHPVTVAAVAAPRSPCPRPRPRPVPPSCCIHSDTPIDRPDPAIYSQAEQFAIGVAPTWNSPDITTNFIGAGKLMPEAKVVVRNLSPTASAIGTNVHCLVSRFGIGFPRNQFGVVGINLPPGAQKELLVPFPQAVLAGEQRVAFHVRIEHPTDAVMINNEGSQIIDAFATSKQGRSIATSFLVRNPLGATQTIAVQKLTTPPGIQATFLVSGTPFGPFEERLCSVQIDVEAWLVGGGGVTHDCNITFVARGADGGVIDGLTFYVGVDS